LKKVAVFVDVQNIYYTVKQNYACHFNYAAFLADVRSRGEVVKAFAYAIDRGDTKQRQFQQILKSLGFEIKLKPYIQRRDGSAKGDWDVGITLDVIDHASAVDTIVLASGDGDFDLLVHKLRAQYGLSAEVYGVPGLTANSLIEAATEFFPIQGPLLLK
jgi:uncharacterized LabA/DUF88 family protein